MATSVRETEKELSSEASNNSTTTSISKSDGVQAHDQFFDKPRSQVFGNIWRHSTADNNLTLYGFRRFKTSHLVNLHFLEEEISVLDRQIYQVGLKLGSHEENRDRDRLGLRFSQRDSPAPTEEFITDSMVLKLRSLLKEYDDALASFNKLMAMETFSLIDDEYQCKERTDLHPHEMYHTRLVRVDLGSRTEHDPFRRGIQKTLQRLRYWRMRNKDKVDEEHVGKSWTSTIGSYQNTALIADVLSCFVVAVVASAFMVVPLIMVSYQKTMKDHLITISVWIILFSLLISTTLRAPKLATMGVAAAYAAILSVFVSNT